MTAESLTHKSSVGDLNVGSLFVGFPVFISIYDLSGEIKGINEWTRTINTGVFHVGVHVHNREFCFGATEEIRTGVYDHPPRQNPVHVYREEVYLGVTDLSPKGFASLITSKKEDWCGTSYHLFRNNCVTFAYTLLEDLNIRKAPYNNLDPKEVPTYISSLMSAATLAADTHENMKDVFEDISNGIENLAASIDVKPISTFFNNMGSSLWSGFSRSATSGSYDSRGQSSSTTNNVPCGGAGLNSRRKRGSGSWDTIHRSATSIVEGLPNPASSEVGIIAHSSNSGSINSLTHIDLEYNSDNNNTFSSTSKQSHNMPYSNNSSQASFHSTDVAPPNRENDRPYPTNYNQNNTSIYSDASTEKFYSSDSG